MTAEDKKRSKAKSAQPDTAKQAASATPTPEEARTRLGATGRNDACPCGSGKKYKKCHLPADEQAAAPPVTAPDAQELLSNGWRLFEQRRPGAAEKEFRAALAVAPDLTDARVGIGMARLSAGNADGAKEELSAVLAAGEGKAAELRAAGTKDAFSQPEVQPYIRAAHALGCLAYDEERYEDGIEARLIAAKALMKLERAADAAALLEPATKIEAGKGRAELGMALAKFSAGAEAEAGTALNAALDSNAHYGKALLGRVRRRVENVAAAQPGSLEEALLYTQTYGDVWTDGAKAFLEKVLDERAAAKKSASEVSDAGAAPPA
jgi:hypothetical protein